MTTYDNDMVRLHFTIGAQTIPCKALGLEWPPPERIVELNGTTFEPPLIRVRMSQLTDEMADHPHLARGAEYYYEDQVSS
jgi:hypothetical protein